MLYYIIIHFIDIASCISLSFLEKLCIFVWLVLITFITKYAWICLVKSYLAEKYVTDVNRKYTLLKCIGNIYFLFILCVIVSLLKIGNKLSLHNEKRRL